MARLLVTVGTDGFTDWVKLPDGSRLNLGPISVLKLVSKLAPSRGAARSTLDSFLKDGEAMFSVDEAKMWALFAPRRAIWAGDDGPFMVSGSSMARHVETIAPDQRSYQPPLGEPQGQGTMSTIHEDLTKLETHIQALNKAAANKVPAAKMQEGHEILFRLAQKIKSPNQSKNETYYGLGAPDVHEVSDAAPKPHTVQAGQQVEGLAYDTVKGNEEIAGQILAKAEETVEIIDKLAAAGKPFKADQAKADVHAVTSKVGGILSDTDLTAAWVREDLQKLAGRMDQIHGLFASATV